MIGCYLQAIDQVLQRVDSSQCVVVIRRHVSQDRQRLSVVGDGLPDGAVDAGQTLDGGVSLSSAAIDLLIEPCGGRGGVSFGTVGGFRGNGLCQGFTLQGVQRVVQLLRAAADASQSVFGVGLGNIDSVPQLVDVLQRGRT